MEFPESSITRNPRTDRLRAEVRPHPARQDRARGLGLRAFERLGRDHRDGKHLPRLGAHQDRREAFNTGYSVGMLRACRLADVPGAKGLDLRITFNLIGSEMVVEIVAAGDSPTSPSLSGRRRWSPTILRSLSPSSLACRGCYCPATGRGPSLTANWSSRARSTCPGGGRSETAMAP